MASGSGAKRRVQKCIEINLARRGVASSSLGTAACAKLESRRVIRVAGGDSLKFLQGLVTNDVNTLSPQQPLLYTHLLNHKGRSLFDMFVYLDHRSATGEEEEGNIYLLDCRRVDKNGIVVANRDFLSLCFLIDGPHHQGSHRRNPTPP